MIENWKNAVYNGEECRENIEVSDKGNVKIDGKLVTLSMNKDGYAMITYYSKSKKINKIYYVHRLVAETFLIHKEDESEIHHINEIKNDNNISNLRWVSVKEHLKIHNNLWKNSSNNSCNVRNNKCENHPRHKLTRDEVMHILENYNPIKLGFRGVDLADKLCVGRSTINMIIRNKRWTEIDRTKISNKYIEK